MFKSLIYGTIVAGVACYYGFHTSGGAKGVGRAVTLAAIYTNLYIVLANFVSSQILELFHALTSGGSA
jgi:phospholipid/cholesterol/gamma-HCH transport system permease protein